MLPGIEEEGEVDHHSFAAQREAAFKAMTARIEVMQRVHADALDAALRYGGRDPGLSADDIVDVARKFAEFLSKAV